MRAVVLDVGLIRKMLAARRPMDEIVARSGASVEQIERINRQFPLPVSAVSTKSKWTEHYGLLKRFHADGWTAKRVAAHFNVSRNAIIGIWSRMGLRSAGRPGPAPLSAEEKAAALQRRRERHNAREREKRAQRRAGESCRTEPRRTQKSILAAILANPSVAPMTDETKLPTNLVPILVKNSQGKLEANSALTNDTCRWWIGTPQQPGAGFCPETKENGLPYCRGHAVRAFQPPQVRRQRAAPAPKPERIPTFADAESE